MKVLAGATNVTTYFALRRFSNGGQAATALTIADIDLQYVRSGVAPVAKVDATALAAADTAHTDNYAFEVDATDQPGLYRVDWPDAAFAGGVSEVILTVKVDDVYTEHLRVEIDNNREFHFSCGYTTGNQLEMACWLTTPDGAIVNITTVGDIKIVDRAGSDAVTDAEWDTTPTELGSFVVHAVRTDASGDLSAGQLYIVEAILDSVTYRETFTMSA